MKPAKLILPLLAAFTLLSAHTCDRQKIECSDPSPQPDPAPSIAALPSGTYLGYNRWGGQYDSQTGAMGKARIVLTVTGDRYQVEVTDPASPEAAWFDRATGRIVETNDNGWALLDFRPDSGLCIPPVRHSLAYPVTTEQAGDTLRMRRPLACLALQCLDEYAFVRSTTN
jgi:hypothetical protein